MSFNPEVGRAEYTASATQTVFPFAFKIFVNENIKVYQTPLGQTADDIVDIILLTTDYTVTINGDLGGTMTLNNGATLGDSITIVRDLAITRPVEYQTNGDLLATTLNEDQEYQTYLTADQQDKNALHVSLQESSQGVSNILPSPDALKVIGWNDQADALENFTIGDDDVFINIRNENSMEDLLSVNVNVYSTVNIQGYTTANDGGGGIFNYDATIDKSTANAGTIIDPSISLANQGTGVGFGCWVRQYSGAVHTKWFGMFPGLATDSAPILNAILLDGFRDIIIEEGSYVCDTPILTGVNSLLDITGLYLRSANRKAVFSYTGTGFLFDIRGSSPIEDGYMTFKNLHFISDKISAGIFNYNDLAVDPIDGVGASYIQFVRYENCFFWGANVSGLVPLVTGNGIQGVKVFGMHIDEHCAFQGFKRGVYLYGSDNNTIAARFPQNVRHIQLVASGTFGNDNLITSRFLGLLHATGVEDAYCIYDQADHSSYLHCELEPNFNAKAFMYLNGFKTDLVGIDFSGGTIPLYELGTNARDVVLTNPKSSNYKTETLLYEPFFNVDYRVNGSWNGITVINPQRTLISLEPHPRLRVHSLDNEFSFYNQSQITMSSTDKLKRYDMSAIKYTGRSGGIGWTGFDAPDDIISDSDGWAVSLEITASPKGFSIPISASNIKDGSFVTMEIEYKYPSLVGVGALITTVDLNNTATFLITPLAAPVSITKAKHKISGVISGIVDTDILYFWVYTNGYDIDSLLIYNVEISVSEDPIADTSGAILADLETEVNKLKLALRESKLIGE